MKNQLKLFFLYIAFFLSPIISLAQDGNLDATFGTDGIVLTNIRNNIDSAQSVVIQNDGKIVVAGNSYVSPGSDSDFAVARYNSDGSLDTTFDNDGKVLVDIGSQSDLVGSMAVQSDGKILVAGYSIIGPNLRFALARFNSNGSLDTTFDTDGKLTTIVGSSGKDGAYSMAIQPDGKIVAAGFSYNYPNYDLAVVRYNNNGTLDTTFGVNGKKTTFITSGNDQALSVAIQSDGKIVVAGVSNSGSSNSDIVLVRYNTNGSLDTTFDTDGILITDIGNTNNYARSVAIQSDGKIIVAGNSSDSNFVLIRYNTDGSLDTTFDLDGIVTTTGGYSKSLAIQSDGKIVVAGDVDGGILNSDFALLRYNTNGSLDATFGTNGIERYSILDNYDIASSIAIQSDAKIVLAGSSSQSGSGLFALIRCNSTVLGYETEYIKNQFIIYPNPATSTLKIKNQENNLIKKIKIMNLLGQVIFEKDISNKLNTLEINIDISSFLKGSYLLTISSDNNDWSSKFIKN